MEGLAEKYNFSTTEKFGSLPEPIKKIILNGESNGKSSFPGIVAHLSKLWNKSHDKTLRDSLSEYKSELISIIDELFDSEIPFVHRQAKESCFFCDQ